MSVRAVPAVTRAVAILRLLGRSKTPMGMKAIAQALDLVPSTALHILRALVIEELVEVDAAKRYRLGLGTLALASPALAGGKEGSIGVGAETELNGEVAGVSANYDAGQFHVGGVLGYSRDKASAAPMANTVSTFVIGARFFYHVHSAGQADFGVGGAIDWKTTDKLTTSIFAEYARLTGPAADSSLVEERGSPNQYLFGVSATYRFDFHL